MENIVYGMELDCSAVASCECGYTKSKIESGYLGAKSRENCPECGLYCDSLDPLESNVFDFVKLPKISGRQVVALDNGADDAQEYGMRVGFAAAGAEELALIRADKAALEALAVFLEDVLGSSVCPASFGAFERGGD